MLFFDDNKSIIENLYLLSGPLIFIISLFGLRQLKIAKDNIRINSQREASTLSFELCEKYEKSIERKKHKLLDKLKEVGVDYEKLFELNPSDLRKLPSSILENEHFKKFISNRDALSYYTIDLANEVEGFCMPFTKKLADEELAYDLQFNQFYYWSVICMVEIYYTQNIANKLIKVDYYGNICDLYKIWKTRNEKENIDRQIATLISKKNKIKPTKIKPLGTE